MRYIILFLPPRSEVFDMARKRITVTQESPTGRNLKFHDNRTGADMTRARFVKLIEAGKYPKYHVRKIGGGKTPVSNPDDRNIIICASVFPVLTDVNREYAPS